MNSVILTGYIKTKNSIRTSKGGTQYLKNVLMVGSDKNNAIEHIPFIAFDEEALAIDKAGAGVTIEVKGRIKSNWDKETKTSEVYVIVDDVQLTNEIQSEEAFNDSPMENVDDMGDDDLPF